MTFRLNLINFFFFFWHDFSLHSTSPLFLSLRPSSHSTTPQYSHHMMQLSLGHQQSLTLWVAITPGTSPLLRQGNAILHEEQVSNYQPKPPGQIILQLPVLSQINQSSQLSQISRGSRWVLLIHSGCCYIPKELLIVIQSLPYFSLNFQFLRLNFFNVKHISQILKDSCICTFSGVIRNPASSGLCWSWQYISNELTSFIWTSKMLSINGWYKIMEIDL